VFKEWGKCGDNPCVSADDLLASIRAAVEARPDDVPLRLHFAGLLDESGDRAEAVRQAATVLQVDPVNPEALRIVTGTGRSASLGHEPASAPAEPADPGAPGTPSDVEILRGLDAEFDTVPPMFADDEAANTDAYDVESTGLTLVDVGGMQEVKARLEASVLAPIRNPELKKLYGKSLRGGLLLYGPPGCGKTFIARALAGEMAAKFMSVTLADVLDMYIGNSEHNIAEIFAIARRNAPIVLFLDEIDALGLKRSQLRSSAARGTVNQLLAEMDGVAQNNEGVFVLGATNHPWDVDVALRRPGRFDRTVLVLPPDEPAREAILRFHLRDRPVANVDVASLAKATDGYSGADLAYVCEAAAERALLDSARTGQIRMIDMNDMRGAVGEVRPSIGAWLDTAKNVAQFANEGGDYDDLLAYLRRRKMVR
jgi:ATP-dependent 26S proteasome regulatory subunit